MQDKGQTSAIAGLMVTAIAETRDVKNAPKQSIFYLVCSLAQSWEALMLSAANSSF
jgi:hypothetical protein